MSPVYNDNYSVTGIEQNHRVQSRERGKNRFECCRLVRSVSGQIRRSDQQN